MSIKLITPPASEPVSLEQARAQARVDGSQEDALLSLYIEAARGYCEELLGRALVTQTWEQQLDAFPRADIKLLMPKAQSIVSVAYTDAEGNDQVLPSTAYVLDPDAAPGGWLLPAAGTAWPATAPVINAVRIRFVAGYGEAAQVPAPIRLWILAAVVTQYEQRSAIVVGTITAALPDRFIDRLLDAYRVYG